METSMFLLFLFTISLHNTEEGIWLIRMTQNSKFGFHQAVKQDQFLFAVIAVTAVAYFVTSMFIFYPDNSLFKYAYFGYVVAMMINVIFPHALSTIVERRYSPGLMTGLLLILPIHTILIVRAFHNHLISVSGLIIGTLIMSIAMILLIPVMFKLSARLLQ
ncbi:HXXEE domain-containing protein [Sporolactobacillus shoreae]|uniref:HXXEE domain-containing protein n=1 Tax=Sporolactobacillus shoreae TaxID=1465501 RepID=A0A4Z0GJR7_9BACL|nr:HXXEE domain-containing protein [Sporolactobacillus shoreae]TGA96277.1 HXXEE domain-containing protein [Sporolactobacillus shoreae]